MKYKQGQFIVWLDFHYKFMFNEIIEITKDKKVILKDVDAKKEWAYRGTSLNFLDIIDVVNAKPSIKDYPSILYNNLRGYNDT